MGLNMPARTVVFTAMNKWDGEAHRFMSSGEYIQMSGRAGRRGKDDRGMCIMMIDEKMDAPTCRHVPSHAPVCMESVASHALPLKQACKDLRAHMQACALTCTSAWNLWNGMPALPAEQARKD